LRRPVSIPFILLLIFAACPDDTPANLVPPELIAPADGSTATQNPLTFIWHSIDQTQILYQFEVASDSGFGTIVFSSASIFPPDTSYALDSVLTPGTYYWHACVWQDC